jgi:hypothetical protein
MVITSYYYFNTLLNILILVLELIRAKNNFNYTFRYLRAQKLNISELQALLEKSMHCLSLNNHDDSFL